MIFNYHLKKKIIFIGHLKLELLERLIIRKVDLSFFLNLNQSHSISSSISKMGKESSLLKNQIKIIKNDDSNSNRNFLLSNG